ncbi:Flagellar hook-associated protein 1 [Thalassocella blandensis]|nr:Flagellar hook-associated protein 1 [Thalassocella blandensis]
MTSNLLGISVSGLRVAQTALNTTGHNISNAGVDGYSRQRVLSETNPANLQGGGWVGNGANVQSIERVASEFVNSQLRSDTSLYKDLELYYDNIAQLDVILSDVSTGLSSGLESFYAAVQNGADDPTSIPARQLIISEAENLSDRFNTIYEKMQVIENNINDQMQTAVSQINALSQNIAGLNQKISNAMGTGAIPNDLIDQRDEAIRKLSEIVSIQTFEEGFGQVNVVVGSGQNLVIGTESRQLQLIESAENANQYDVAFKEVGKSQSRIVITDLVSGGELGGVIRFRDSILEGAYNDLGRIAVSMADAFNTTHQMGIDLNNEFGGNFFYDVNDPDIASNRVISHSTNPPPYDRRLSLTIENTNELVSSDYTVSVEAGGLFRIHRDSDGEEVVRGALNGGYPFSVEFDGLEFTFESGSFQAGDSFTLQPFKSAGRDFSSALVNPEDIAFGSPLLTDTAIGNTGSGAISAGEVLSLLDQNNLPLPLLANTGEMDPPLLVNFITPTVYEILDNSDPGNPVDLDPPIRNQQFIVGGQNNLFGTDPGETMVSTNGDLIGLPEGRRATTNASIQNANAVPSFANTDFSGAASFSFEIVVENTPGGINNTAAPIVVTVDSASIVDEDALLLDINTNLTGTDVRAYMNDAGELAFRLNTAGAGDITLQNFAGGIAGQADALMGYDIENSGTVAITTLGNLDGFSGQGQSTNGYPAEAITITRPSEIAGGTPTTYNLFTSPNASAMETASLLNNIEGVSANAFNYIELSHLNVTRAVPLQFNLNGENLVEYSVDSTTGDAMVSDGVPDPQTEEAEFYDYLAQRINENETLAMQGVYAVAGVDPVSGANELRVYDSQGNDLTMGLTAATGETVDISDGENPNLQLSATGGGTTSSITVGGRIDVSMEDTLSLSTFPRNSMIFGDTTAADFAKSTYQGIQAKITGTPDEGDRFTLDFNENAAMDNRNALTFTDLQNARMLDGGVSSIADSYSSLVEDVGIDTASTKINLDASEQVLAQSVERRNSISGVNLDEEAANLIKFEQLYSANAQVISVARDLFDRLINAF